MRAIKVEKIVSDQLVEFSTPTRSFKIEGEYRKQTITAAFLAASLAAPTNSFVTDPLSLPANTIIEAITVNVKTAFDGALNLTVAPLSGPIIINNFDLSVVGAISVNLASRIYAPTFIQLTAGVTIGGFTAGEVDIIVKVKDTANIVSEILFVETQV